MSIRFCSRFPFHHRLSAMTFAGLTSLLLVPPASAATTDCATDWANFTSSPGYMADYTSEGQIIADEETSADTSHGSAAVTPSWTDLASGSPSSYPGPEATSSFGYYNGGTVYDPDDPTTMEDDFILFRMRVEGNPTTGPAFDSKHWNVLFDIDADGYKDYWVDLDGSVGNGKQPDAVKILYDPVHRQDIPDPVAAEVDAFTAWNTADYAPSCPAGSAGRSHTRTMPVGDGTPDYWIDIQVPMTAFVDHGGNQLLWPDSPVAFVFSTGASNQNPLQKDFMHDIDFLTLADPISFGDIIIPNGRPRIQFTDSELSSVESYVVGDKIYFYLNDRLANTDPASSECVTVTVTNPAIGDDEQLTLCEVSPNSGIFTNRGGACAAEITVPAPAPQPPTAWIPAIYTSDTTIEETWTLVYDAVAGNWTVTGSVSGLQSTRAANDTPYTSDGGEIAFTLYENSPTNGTTLSFCTRGADPLTTSEVAGVDDDGDLQVAAGDEITVSYTNSQQITVTDSAVIVGPCEAFLVITRANGLPSTEFELTDDPATSDQIYVTVYLGAANTDPLVAETIQVVLTGNDTQTLTLTETGPDTGQFRNTTGLQTKVSDGVVTAEDNLWEDVDRGVVTATYDYTCGGDSLSVSDTSELFYIQAAGRARFTNGAGTQDVELYGHSEPIFITVRDENACTTTVVLGDLSTVETVTVTVTSPSGDSETLTLYETSPGSGVFINRLNDLVTIMGSAVVTSAASTFQSDGLQPGDPFIIATGPDVGTYQVASVDSETQVTLTEALGAGRIGVGFTSAPLLTATDDGAVTADDGILEADHDDDLTVTYSDCDDGDLDSTNDQKTDTARYSAPPLVINEVLFYPDNVTSCQTEAVELLNNTSAPLNVTGYELTDEDTFTYVIPQYGGADLVLQPGETIFLSLYGSTVPDNFYSAGTYYLFTSGGTDYPSDHFADPDNPDGADQISLYDAGGTILDYVGWTATATPSLDALGDDSAAVLRAIWQDDAFRDVSTIPLGYSLARTSPGFDTDEPSDWEFLENNECQFITTRALIVSFAAYREDGRVVVRWETDGEDGTVGFDLLRREPETGRLVRVHEDLLVPVVGSAQGGVYHVVDPGVGQAGTLTYRLVEIEATRSGTREKHHGPYTVALQWPQDDTGFDPAGPDYQASAWEIPPGQLQRLEAHDREHADAGQRRHGRVGSKIKILLTAAGLYYLDAEEIAGFFDLPSATIQGWIRGARLAVSNQGREVAWLAADDASGIFFYGAALDSIYARENVYWLEKGNGLEMEVDRGSGPRPASGPQTYLATETWEEDIHPLTSVVADPDSDFWYWKFFSSGHSVWGTHTLTVDLSAVAPSGQARLTLDLQGASDTGVPDEHHVEVRVNGSWIGESRWQGNQRHLLTLELDGDLLAEGSNSIELRGVLDSGVPYSIFYLDSLAVSYPRFYQTAGPSVVCRGDGNPVVTVSGFTRPEITVLEISDPTRPRLITGTTVDASDDGYRVSFRPSSDEAFYFVSTPDALGEPEEVFADQRSDLRNRKLAADYLVVAPGELVAAAEGLADLRRSDGLEAMVVDLEDVYDEFHGGIPSPHAIREMLVYAHRNWSVAPRYLVLAGDGSFDFKNVWGVGGNLIPPLMASSDWGAFAADNRLADLAGDDGVPEVAIGRLPVLTSDELMAYVQKVAAYEAAAGIGWSERVFLVADDNPDGLGDFRQDSDSMAALLPPAAVVETLYLSEQSAAVVRQRLLAGFEQGVSLINYVGHAGLDRLADEGLLLRTDVAGLTNGERLPVVTGFACAFNRFEIPGYAALGETLAVHPDGGAVAVWGPSGMSEDTQARSLGQAFFRAAFQNGEIPDAEMRLGDVLLQALADYEARGGKRYMREVYNLLGDPALRVKFPAKVLSP